VAIRIMSGLFCGLSSGYAISTIIAGILGVPANKLWLQNAEAFIILAIIGSALLICGVISEKLSR